MFQVPGLWHDVDGLIRVDSDMDDFQTAKVKLRCQECHASYLAWLDAYQEYCVASSLRIPSGAEVLLRRQTFSSVLECLIIMKRLLATIDQEERLKLETETQALALLLRSIHVESCPRFSWLFTGHELGVANSIIATREAFQEHTTDESTQDQLHSRRRRYILWNDSLRGRPEAEEQPKTEDDKFED